MLVGSKTMVKFVNAVFLEASSGAIWDPAVSLSVFVNLENLSLYLMRGVCTDTIRGLTRLSSLCLDDSNVDYDALVALPSLTSLTLGTRNRGIKDFDLSALTNLTSLSMYSAPGISGTGVSTLVNLRTLHLMEESRIDADFRQVTDETLSRLTNLTALTLDETSVTDAGIARLTKLETLSLYHHSITNKGIDKLSSLTKLELWHSCKIQISSLSSAIDVTYYPSHDFDTQTEEEEDT